LIEKLNKIKSFSTKLNEEENKLKILKASLMNFKKPELTNQELIIKTQIKNLEQEKEEKNKLLTGKNPNQDLLDQNNIKLNESAEDDKNTRIEIQNLETLNSYYEFWFEAFGDEGIRKLVVNEIIPALNSRLSYWLQILIDNKIEIKFDSSLNEFISKFPDCDKELIYAVLSNGQKRRINLAVNQAFAHVMMLSHGVAPNIIFLDEVTSNIDQIGVQAIYDMICELSKSKKVFVTTHDQDLISMLSGCQEMVLEMKDGESFLKSI
jgi:DNA repair exonuclease SbcCD ATPase subunit